MTPAKPANPLLFSVQVKFLLALLLTACSPTTDYKIAVENRSNQTIETFLIQAAGEPLSLGSIRPGEKRVETMTLTHGGSLSYQFKIGETCHTGQLEEQAVPGQPGDKTIIVEQGGEVRIIDEIHHTEVTKPAQKPATGEWALPCMIPG